MTWWTSKSNVIHPKIKHKFVVVFGSDFFIPSIKSIGKPKIEFETKEYTLINHKFNYPGNGKWQPIDIKFVDMNGMGNRKETFDTSAFLWQILNNTGYAYPYLDGSSQYSINPYYNNVQGGETNTNGGHHIATIPSFRDDPNTPNVVERSSFRTITTPEKSSTIANSFGKGLTGIIDYEEAHYSKQKISIYQLAPNNSDNFLKGAIVSECWHLVNPLVKTIEWGDLAYDSDELVEYSLNIIYDWAIYDRAVIGTPFDVDAEPFDSFMKKFGQAKTKIDQEIEQQLELEELRMTAETMDIEELRALDEKLKSDNPIDLNNDGVISDEERSLWDKKDGKFTPEAQEFRDEVESLIEERESYSGKVTRDNLDVLLDELDERAAYDEITTIEVKEENISEEPKQFQFNEEIEDSELDRANDVDFSEFDKQIEELAERNEAEETLETIHEIEDRENQQNAERQREEFEYALYENQQSAERQREEREKQERIDTVERDFALAYEEYVATVERMIDDSIYAKYPEISDAGYRAYRESIREQIVLEGGLVSYEDYDDENVLDTVNKTLEQYWAEPDSSDASENE